MRRISFTPTGGAAAAATRLGATWQGEMSHVGSPGLLVPLGPHGEEQRATLLPFKGKSVKWPN